MAPGPTPLVPKPQALRYRRGKLPTGAPIPSDSDDTDNSDDDEENDVSEKNRGRRAGGERTGIKGEGQDGVVAGGAGRVIQTGPGATAGASVGVRGGKRNIQVALRDVRVEEDGAVYVGGKREVGGGIEEEEKGEWLSNFDNLGRLGSSWVEVAHPVFQHLLYLLYPLFLILLTA